VLLEVKVLDGAVAQLPARRRQRLVAVDGALAFGHALVQRRAHAHRRLVQQVHQPHRVPRPRLVPVKTAEGAALIYSMAHQTKQKIRKSNFISC